ncbi:DNA helicase [Caulobacter phage Lullwater]|uniref:DNA helicase n=1 Tax=Caulobacter phage Lullwater TaxID=2024607 RepID=A0A291LB23_9CAUD|nr:DNA helicase [Caulobacter phage Lullwater]ATI16324.1 DNA helicase [Caulobacter phage Lullwater]
MDLTLLRLLRKRESYKKWNRVVAEGVVTGPTKVILDDYGKWFKEFPDAPEIDAGAFELWFTKFAHPKLSEEKTAVFLHQLREAAEPLDPSLEDGLMARLVDANSMQKLMTLVEKFEGGEEVEAFVEARSLLEKWELELNRKVKTPEVRDSIGDLLAEDENDIGFKFRLDELNQGIRPLRGGDFVILAARPDVGKTTALTSELSFMAPQVDLVYPDEDRDILWFNNEGPGRRIKTRLYQSALNATISDLVARNKAGTIEAEYASAVGGRADRIRVYDIHDFWSSEVEDVIKDGRAPAIIVFDMIDNIRFAGDVGNNGQRTDQLLEAMYQWGRNIAVKYNCVVIATSQISADGENLQYPSLSMLKDSKTGKQGAADLIITIGYNKEYPNARYMGATKNKLAREGGRKTIQEEVRFDGQRGRYVSLKWTTEAEISASVDEEIDA